MPTNPRTGHELITSCSLNTIKLLTTPCRVGHTVFRALAHCGPLCLAKKLKLLFSAAAVMSVMSNCVRPHRWQPTRLPHPWDSPGKNTGVSCHFLLQCRKVKSESEVVQCVRPSVTAWTAATRLLCPWDFPGKSTGVGCYCLLRTLFYFPPNSASMFLFGTGEHRLSFGNKNRRRPGISHSRQFQGKTQLPRSLLSPSVTDANAPCGRDQTDTSFCTVRSFI